MSVRRLFAILLAVAVLIAPAMTNAAAASILAGHDRMLMMDHSTPCQMPAGGSAEHKANGKTCCVSMCMAIAVAPSLPCQAVPMRQQIAQFAQLKPYHGVPAEIATPPPRYS